MSIIEKNTTLISLESVDKNGAVFSTAEPPVDFKSYEDDEAYAAQSRDDYHHWKLTRKKVELTRQTWEDLGRPVTITLTLEGGDLLNV